MTKFKTKASGNGFTLFILAVWIAMVVGYGSNFYKLLINADFEAPYKSEIVRGIGVVVLPVGIVAGYMTLGDEK